MNKFHLSLSLSLDRIFGLDQFEELFAAIVSTFEDMSVNLENKCNRDTSTKASAFLKFVT